MKSPAEPEIPNVPGTAHTATPRVAQDASEASVGEARWQQEHDLRAREVALQERDQQTKEADLDLRRKQFLASQWTSPVVVAVIAATLAFAGNAVVAYVNSVESRKIEELKGEEGFILKMIENPNPDQVAQNLQFLIDSGLVSEENLKSRLESFLKNRPQGKGPAISSVAVAPQGNELQIAHDMAQQVDSGDYSGAVKSFDELRKSHFSGVGFSEYPKAVFAYDQLSNEQGALHVLDLLEARLKQDTEKGYGYLAPGRPPRAFLREAFDKMLPSMKSAKVRERIEALVRVYLS
jgi:hypothetical protein